MPLEWRNSYTVGGWVRVGVGVTAKIVLQAYRNVPGFPYSNFAIAQHSGADDWEYVSATGSCQDYGPVFATRVILLVQGVGEAWFDDIVVQEA